MTRKDELKLEAANRLSEFLQASKNGDKIEAHKFMSPDFRNMQNEDTTQLIADEILANPVSEREKWIVEVDEEGGYLLPHVPNRKTKMVSAYEVVKIGDTYYLTGRIFDLYRKKWWQFWK